MTWEVYKFGGSVLRDAAGVRMMAGRVAGAPRTLVVVVSALGRTTNALEHLARMVLEEGHVQAREEAFGQMVAFHQDMLHELLQGHSRERQETAATLDRLFADLRKTLEEGPGPDAAAWHDAVVSFGELLSSAIVAAALRLRCPELLVRDIRRVIVTDKQHGSAEVDMEATSRRVREVFREKEGTLFLTQGYIAAAADGTPTTLGREGSDYTAALLGSFLGARRVTLWKDVPGVMNADPAVDKKAVHLPSISYQEAAEMAFYGAKVLHPKTIKPLRNGHIPLVVRGLFSAREEKTVIWDFEEMERRLPVSIRKERQVLLSIFPRDYSFVLNSHLVRLAELFREWRFTVSLIQISAISVTYCIDDPGEMFMERVRELQKEYEVYFNRGMELLTFRHYEEQMPGRELRGLRVFLEQRTRLTLQYVVKRL